MNHQGWKDLCPDLLRQIFYCIPLEQLCLNGSTVCRSWRAVSQDLIFWGHNVLDLSAATAGFSEHNSSNYDWKGKSFIECCRAGFFSKYIISSHSFELMDRKVTRLLRRIMEGNDAYGHSLEAWRLSIRSLIIPYDLQVSEENLVYVAERTPGLEHLCCLGIFRISVKGFAEAIKHWPHLKDIELGPVSMSRNVQSARNNHYNRFIEVIGRNCQELKTLHIHQSGFKMGASAASAIGKSLPKLKKLELDAALIFRKGILGLFQMCPQLEINVSKSLGLQDWDLSGEEHDCVLFQNLQLPADFSLRWTVDGEGSAEWLLKLFNDPDHETSYTGLRNWLGPAEQVLQARS